ncbi:MAG: helix-turn-helix domain-containing protein [Alphaproteobacteria bacterium]
MRNIKDYSDIRCPMHGLLNLLSGTWTSYILWLIQEHGSLRFGQLKKQMPGISAKVLTERLRKLEEGGFVSRVQEATIPPKVTYSLTKRGAQLQAPLDQLSALAKKWSSAA